MSDFLKGLLQAAENIPPMVVTEEMLDEALEMAKIHVGKIGPDVVPQLKGEVYMFRNENSIIDEIVKLLGLGKDGKPIQIRTGYVSYDDEAKLLFFAKNKVDLPAIIKAREQNKKL